MRDRIQRFITLIIFLSRKLDTQALLQAIIKVINAAFLILKILHSQITLCVQGSPLEQTVNIAYSNVLMGSTQMFGIYVIGALTVIFVLMCCYFLYFAHNKNSLVNKQGRPELSSGLAFGPIFALLLAELIYSPLVLHLYANYRLISSASIHNLFTIDVCLLIISLIVVAVVTVCNRRNRIFGIFAPLILVLVETIELDLQVHPLVEPLVLAVIICLFIYLDSVTLINHCIYCGYLYTCLFSILNTLDSTQTGRQLVFFIISFGCLQIIILLKRYFEDQKYYQDQFLMQSLQKVELGMSDPISIHAAIRIQLLFRQFIHKNASVVITREMFDLISSKSVQQMSLVQLLKLIDTKLLIESLKDINNIETKKKHYMFRISKSYLVMDTIDEISHFLCENQNLYKITSQGDQQKAGQNNNKSSFLKGLYSRKQVQLTLFQYLSKQPDHDKVLQILKTSTQQQQFFDQSMRVLSHVSSFWQKINMDVLIEDTIEDTFDQMIESLTSLQAVYKCLTQGYRAEWETKIIKLIYQLIEPCTVLKFDDLNIMSKQEEVNEDALLYFVVANKNITKASPHFLKLLDCKKQEVIGEEICKILPEEVIRKLKKPTSDYTSTHVQPASIVPLIVGSHLIEVLEVSIKMQPRISGGIEFFYFLSRATAQQKTTYLYVNLLDLRIQYVSPDFYEHLHLKQSYLENKLNKNQLCLNNIICNIEANAIITELEKNKQLKCVVNVSKLRVKSKGLASQIQAKFPCNLSVTANFDDSMLLCLSIREADQQSKRQSINNNFEFMASGFPNKFNTIGRTTKQYMSMEECSQVTSKIDAQESNILIKVEDVKNSKANAELTESKYCPISNPYRQRIEEKQSEISSEGSSYLAYSTCIIILTCALLLVLAVLIITLGVYNQSQKANTTSITQSLNKILQSACLMVEGTLEVYWQYYLSAQKEDISSVLQQQGLNATVQEMLTTKYDRIHNILSQFYYQFATFYHRDLFDGSSPYVIGYANYQIQTSYSSSNLLQYAYNIKLSSEKIRVQFQQSIAKDLTNTGAFIGLFIRNYPTVSNIDAPFQVLDILIASYRNNLNSNKLLIFVLAGAIPGILFFIVLAIKAHLKIMKQIFHIFAMMDKTEVQKCLCNWETGVALCMSQVPKDSQNKLLQYKSKNTESMILYKSRVKQSSKKIKFQSEKENFKCKQVISDKSEQISYIFKKIKGLLVFSFLFSAIVATFFYKLEIDFKEDEVMIQYVNQIGRIQYKALKNSADMFHYTVQSLAFNTSDKPPTSTKIKRSSVDKTLGEHFINSFRQFYTDQNSILKQDLCEVNSTRQIIDEVMDCSQVGKGILRKGYIQSSQYYDYITECLKDGLMDELSISDGEAYSNILIHVFVRDKILLQLDQLKLKLNQTSNLIQQKYNFNMMVFGILEVLLGLFYVFFLAFYFVPKIIKVREVGRGYFKILPKSTLEKITISSYIKQISLLNKIGYM